MNPQRLPAVKVRIASLLAGRYQRGEQEMEPSVLVTPGGTAVSRARVLGCVVSHFLNEDGTFASVTLDDTSGTIRVKAFRDDLVKVKGLVPGDTVDVIGRVREYEGELYIVPETVLAVKDHNWELVRRLELVREGMRERRVVERARELRSRGVAPAEGARVLGEELGLGSREAEAVLAGPVERAPPEDEGSAERPGGAAPAAGGRSPAAPPTAPTKAAPAAAPTPRAALLALIQKLDRGDGVAYATLSDESKLGDGLDDVLTELISEGEIFEPRTGKYKRLD